MFTPCIVAVCGIPFWNGVRIRWVQNGSVCVCESELIWLELGRASCPNFSNGAKLPKRNRTQLRFVSPETSLNYFSTPKSAFQWIETSLFLNGNNFNKLSNSAFLVPCCALHLHPLFFLVTAGSAATKMLTRPWMRAVQRVVPKGDRLD